MPGGGSVQGMITSLRNNKNLLRSKKLFNKERTFLRIKKENLKVSNGKLNSEKASKEELKQIRKKIVKERYKEKKIVIGITIIVASIFIYFTFNIIQQNNNDLKNQYALQFKNKEKKFLSFIHKGDEWFVKGKWYNSIFYYKKAKDVFPKNYEVNYRLVRSYSFQCENEFKDCHTAKKLLDKLFLSFPDKEDELLQIKDKLEYEYQN